MRILALLLALAVILPAAEVVKAIPLDQLGLPAGSLPADASWEPTVAGGEALADVAERRILLRLPALADVRGILIVHGDGSQPPRPLPFAIPAAVLRVAPDAHEAFDTGMVSYASYWLGLGEFGEGRLVPDGADRGSWAWWHHQMRRSGAPGETPRGRRGNDLDRTIDLFSGTTALRENLQFDRTLRVRGDGEAEVALADLPELEVRPIPWQRMPGNAGPAPTLDLLAARLPDDQHAVLVPSFGALRDGLERLDALLSGPLAMASGSSSESGAARRLQHQLGLELDELSQRFGASVVDQIAITGGDPFVCAGSDVAVLLRAKQPALLAAFLAARVEGLRGAGAAATSGSAGGLAWIGAASADRTISCHVLIDGEVAVVANSPVQLDIYAAVRSGTRPALAAAPEYAFFRRRYALGTPGELALAVVTDATLRRWCSARWRIGDSRRTRAAAVLAVLTCEWIAAGAGAGWIPAVPVAELGTVTVVEGRLHSSIYGSFAFQTPIAELAIDHATREEADAYRRFHDSYQRAWSAFLDPIAVQLTRRPDGVLAADLSIMPLIVSTRYREFIALAGEAKLEPGTADPHQTLLQLGIALDRNRGPVAEWGEDFGRSLGGLASPFAWVGAGASLYLESDPFWTELAMQNGFRERGEFLRNNLSRLPLGVTIAVADPLRLAAFLTALRTMATQAAPGLVTWGAGRHREVDYVVITPSAQAGTGMAPDTHLYYLPAPEGLTLTTNEALLHRAIDRVLARRQGAKPGTWPGEHLALMVEPAALDLVAALAAENSLRDWMGRRADAGIAILNEWKRLFPDQDPVAVHERLWGVRPVCPAGGTFAWDEQWLTMSSSALGHMALPAEGPALPSGLQGLGRLSFGLAFEPLPQETAPGGSDDRNPEANAWGPRVRLEAEPLRP